MRVQVVRRANHHRPWRSDDDDMVAFWAGYRGWEWIGQAVGRRPESCYRRWLAIRRAGLSGNGGTAVALGVGEVAAILGIHERTVRHRIRTGDFGTIRRAKPTPGCKRGRYVIPEERLYQVLADPLYFWRFDLDLMPESEMKDHAREARANHPLYMDLREVADVVYAAYNTVHAWVRRGWLPVMWARSVAPPRIRVTPRKVVEKFAEIYNSGCSVRLASAAAWETAEEIRGYDVEVAVPWREPFRVEMCDGSAGRA